MTRYAKQDVYAEVEEEGGKVNRLVAVAGQVVPEAYIHLVSEKETTSEQPAEVTSPALARGTSTRRAVTPTVHDAEEAREAAEKGGDEKAAPKTSRARRSS